MGDCPGFLPQDPQDYPQDIHMHPWTVAKDGVVESIQYVDRWGGVEYIEDVESLCDRAGCQCVGPSIECNNVEGLFYDPSIAAKYAERCFHTCQCLAIRETPDVTDATRPIDLGEGGVVNLPESLQNRVSRLNPDGAPLGHGACLAGETSGWTFKRLAQKACCSGYSFHALSPQEAYMIYGFPLVSEIIAGLVTVGVCLPTSSAPKSG